MAGNGHLELKNLPTEVLEQIQDELDGAVSKKHRRPKPPEVTRGEILVVCVQVLATLERSKLPANAWYKVLGQCQRWVRNPGRMSQRTRLRDR